MNIYKNLTRKELEYEAEVALCIICHQLEIESTISGEPYNCKCPLVENLTDQQLINIVENYEYNSNK